MSYGVSNETPWNSDAYDTKNATILSKISISLDPLRIDGPDPFAISDSLATFSAAKNNLFV